MHLLLAGLTHFIIAIIRIRGGAINFPREPICEIINNARQELGGMLRLIFDKFLALVEVLQVGIIWDIVKVGFWKPANRKKRDQKDQNNNDKEGFQSRYLHLGEDSMEIWLRLVHKTKKQILAHYVVIP